MKRVAETEQFHVYDDVLSPEDVRALWNLVQLSDYDSVHKKGCTRFQSLANNGTETGTSVVLGLRATPPIIEI